MSVFYRIILSGVFSVFFILSIKAQHIIKGTVRDADTREPIVLASILTMDHSTGTLSNENGEFSLNVPSLPVDIIISHLSYKKDSIKVSGSGSLEISLNSVVYELPAVNVGSYANILVVNASRKLFENYPLRYYGKAFYRQLTQVDNRPTEYQEMIYNSRMSNARLEGSLVESGRYAATESIIKYTNFSFFFKSYGIYHGDSSMVNVLHPESATKYRFELIGLLKDGTREVAEISFKCKPDKCESPVSGTVFIDTESYEVQKIIFYISDNMGVEIKNKNPLWQIKAYQHLFNLEMSYRYLGSQSVLDYIKVNFSFNYKFRKEDHHVNVSSLTYFYDTTDKPKSLNYEDANPKISDRDVIKSLKYDPGFWLENSVVKKTSLQEEVIRSFEKDGAFGTMMDGRK